jgi:hypothetical protein
VRYAAIKVVFLNVLDIGKNNMQQRKLIIYECSVENVNVNGVPTSQIITKKQPKLQKTLRNIDVEGSRKEARELLVKLQRKVRTINFDTDGNVKAVIWKGKPPERTKIPGWRFKKPK